MLVYPHIHSICLLFGSNSLLEGVLRLYSHVYNLFSCFLGLTPFLQVFYACIPMYTFYFLAFWVYLPSCKCFTLVYLCIRSICLLFGSNSLLAGVLRLYTHVYILFACFLGLTPFLQVLCPCIPRYTFYFHSFWV